MSEPVASSRGKKWKRPVVTFGERIWFRPLKSYLKGQSDLESRLLVGRYIGTHGRNGDVLVMTAEGVLKGGSIKRMPVKERWDPSDLDGLRGTPWSLRPKLAEDVDSLPVRIDLPDAEGIQSHETVHPEACMSQGRTLKGTIPLVVQGAWRFRRDCQ